MPDKYESLYAAQYGTTSVSGDFTVSAWTQYVQVTTQQEPVAGQLFLANLTVSSYLQTTTVTVVYDPEWLWVETEFDGNNVELFWEPPTMVGATHVAGFRRSGTDTAPFTPTPAEERFRVPVPTTSYTDENVPVGNYVYQVFPLFES